MNPISDIPLWTFEWAGTFLGLTGAALLSLNVRASRFGWLLFLLSTVPGLLMESRLVRMDWLLCKSASRSQV